MREIDSIVLRAANLASSPAARREAFGELVIRFQDMAFACAFAVLGDVYLAQDTAQEAFVVAWQKLAQLREPAAFPGWFKRIVLTQCHRLTRCKRLQMVPLESDVNASTNDPGPHVAAERNDLFAKVLQAISAHPRRRYPRFTPVNPCVKPPGIASNKLTSETPTYSSPCFAMKYASGITHVI